MKAKKIAALCLASVLLLSGCGGKTVDGKSVVASTSEKINNEGYEWVKKELGIELQKEDEDVVSIGVCGHKVTSNV